jgi:hypothetical protein
MDAFSYLVILSSIVLGLGLTRLVGGLGYLMQIRKRKRTYWVHTLWTLNVLLAMIIVWWFAYRWHSYERWTFFLFLWLLISPIVLYLIASLLFPDPDDGLSITDWRTHYYANHRDIFLLLSLIFPIDIIDTLLKGMAHFRDQGPAYFITMALWFTLCLIAALTKSTRYHAFFAVIFMIYNLGLLGASLLTERGVSIPALIQPQ